MMRKSALFCVRLPLLSQSNRLRTKRKLPFADDLSHWFARRGFFPFSGLWGQLVRIARTAHGEHRADGVIVRHSQFFPCFLEIKSLHAVNNEAHGGALQREIFESQSRIE